MNLSFQDTGYVWWMAGAVLLAVLFLLLLRWKKKVRARMGNPSLVNGLMADYSPRRFFFKFCLVLLAFIAGVTGLMNLRAPGKTTGGRKSGIDAVVALDVSRSMLATDAGSGRIELARQFIGRLLDLMPDDRVGLVLFAGKAYLQMPLTADHAAAKLYVAGAGPESVAQQGTVITEALDMCGKAFPASDNSYKAVVLVTDGEGHDGGAVALAHKLARSGVMINTVGIGSPDGAVIPDAVTGAPKKDEAGNVIVSKLNEELLKDIAEATNGVYVHLQNAGEAAGLVKQQLARIDKKAYADESTMQFRRYFTWFAAIMLLALVLEPFISEKRKTAVAVQG